jgi:hypothetical protein
MFAVASDLSKLVPCLVAAEHSPATDGRFCSLVSNVLKNCGGDVMTCLADIHIATGGRDFVTAWFFSWELSGLGRFEPGGDLSCGFCVV